MTTRAHLVALFAGILATGNAHAQQRINGSFPFQTEPDKEYAIYVPSSYEEGVPHRLMVGMHPLNTSRWNAISWCDTLTAFAEENQLILACPDGGADGSVDDPIDHDFTTALLDSMRAWYSVDLMKTYIMGFSFGGKATYRYGLANPDVFGGYLPIGAAINGTTDVNATLQANSVGKAIYIVHGSQDSPTTRYTPVLNALTNSGAIVNSILMNGVGHTIDFPNRNAILGAAFQWIDSVNCAGISTGFKDRAPSELEIRPTILDVGQPLTFDMPSSASGVVHVTIYDMGGAVQLNNVMRASQSGPLTVPLHHAPGAYAVSVKGAVVGNRRIVVR